MHSYYHMTGTPKCITVTMPYPCCLSSVLSTEPIEYRRYLNQIIPSILTPDQDTPVIPLIVTKVNYYNCLAYCL